MTQENFERYKELDEEFQNKCDYVVERLRKYFPGEDWDYVSYYKLDSGEVECWGHDSGEAFFDWFPYEYITMSNDELELALKQKKAEKVKEMVEKKKEQEKFLEECEKAEYRRLKEKYGRSLD